MLGAGECEPERAPHGVAAAGRAALLSQALGRDWGGHPSRWAACPAPSPLLPPLWAAPGSFGPGMLRWVADRRVCACPCASPAAVHVSGMGADDGWRPCMPAQAPLSPLMCSTGTTPTASPGPRRALPACTGAIPLAQCRPAGMWGRVVTFTSKPWRWASVSWVVESGVRAG